MRVSGRTGRIVTAAGAVAVAFAAGLAAGATWANDTVADAQAGCVGVLDGRAETDSFLDANAARYRAAITRARGWLDRLEVDHVRIRAAGLKGKKKHVEYLDSYRRLLAIAEPADRPAIMERINRIAAEMSTAAWHNLAAVNDTEFKQDATSYLRAALLLDRLGLDTTGYREEIRKVKPRLDGHMTIRGPHQRMIFHWYYRHFGLEEPFDLAAGFGDGVIAGRLDPYRYNDDDVYGLTHEVFAPYEYGEKLTSDFFGPAERAYLRRTLDVLATRYRLEDNADLLAELLSCIRYLGFTDLAIYREGIEYLLSSQHADGKWGEYEKYRKRRGELVDQGWYLHTTSVAIDALTVAFHWREGREAEAGAPSEEAE